MLPFFGTLEVFIKMGLVYSLLAMGYYVSYSLLDFPDLTVEGTFLGGAVTFGLLVSHGCNAWIALFIDQTTRFVASTIRFAGGKWKTIKLG